MTSILTNNSAMIALQTLKTINSNLADTQNAISTGKDIATAKDGSAIWAISKVMEADVAGFNAVSDSLALGESTVAVASAAADQIVTVLTDMKELAISANSETWISRRFRPISQSVPRRLTRSSQLRSSTAQTCWQPAWMAMRA